MMFIGGELFSDVPAKKPLICLGFFEDSHYQVCYLLFVLALKNYFPLGRPLPINCAKYPQQDPPRRHHDGRLQHVWLQGPRLVYDCITFCVNIFLLGFNSYLFMYLFFSLPFHVSWFYNYNLFHECSPHKISVLHTYLEIPSTSILSGADLTKSLGEMSLASTGTFLPPTVSTSRKRQRSAETGETGETGEEGRLGFKQRRISTTQVLFKICV